MTRLRCAAVGYGFIMQRGHAAAYRRRQDVELTAIADVSAAHRELAARQWPQARIYESAEALLTAEADRVDFVDIAVPPCDHAPIALKALDHGLHVLCEKPLATRVDDALQMLRQARRSERVLYPCHNYKHAPVIQAVREILDRGRIGRVRLVTLQTFRNTHARGAPGWRPDWRREQQYSGGGIAMDHGSHTFYLAFEWMRAHPIAISATLASREPFDTEDDFSCSLRFPAGVASAHLSWNAGVRKVLYTIHGERGAVTVEDDDIEVTVQAHVAPGQVRWTREQWPIESEWMDSSHVTWFDSLFDDFLQAIARRDFVGKEAEEAFLCVQLIATAYASARQGGRELPLAGLSALAGNDFGPSTGDGDASTVLPELAIVS